MQKTFATGVNPAVRIESVCTGDAREMGYAQGIAVREKVQQAISIVTELEAFRLQKPAWMPFAVFRKMAEIKAEKFLSAALASYLPHTYARLLGIAEGAGVRLQSLFLLNAMETVMSDISRSTVVPIAAGCSALAITGTSSKTGHPILTHNFDYLPAIQPIYTIRESRPTGKLRSLEFTAAPLVGAVDGMNEAGLCITYNYAYITDKNQAAPTISMWISEALANCRTVLQAVEFLSHAKRSGGGILMLADAEGRIDSLELSATRTARRSNTGTADRLYQTNRFQTETMKKVEVEKTTTYTDRAPKALRTRRVHRSSELRESRFQEKLAQIDRLDSADVAELMSDHGPEGKPSGDSICMHSDYWHTTACLHFFPEERTVKVAYDSACRAKFESFQL